MSGEGEHACRCAHSERIIYSSSDAMATQAGQLGRTGAECACVARPDASESHVASRAKARMPSADGLPTKFMMMAFARAVVGAWRAAARPSPPLAAAQAGVHLQRRSQIKRKGRACNRPCNHLEISSKTCSSDRCE